MRLYFDVKYPLEIAEQLTTSLFVPHRSPAQLGDVVELALRFSGVSRPIPIAVVVTGRRMPHRSRMLVRARDAGDPVLDLVHDVARGQLDDVEARLQQLVRLPMTATYRDANDARAELLGALRSDGAHIELPGMAVRGDHLDLDIRIGSASAMRVEMVVKRVHVLNGQRLAVVAAANDVARTQLQSWLLVEA